jgi:hypothetical protein
VHIIIVLAPNTRQYEYHLFGVPDISGWGYAAAFVESVTIKDTNLRSYEGVGGTRGGGYAYDARTASA